MSAEQGKLPEGAEYRSVDDVPGVEIDRTPTGAVVLTLEPGNVFGVAVGIMDENNRTGHFLITPERVDRKTAALTLARGLDREAGSL